jgi:peptide/nickel transport system permease protein
MSGFVSAWCPMPDRLRNPAARAELALLAVLVVLLVAAGPGLLGLPGQLREPAGTLERLLGPGLAVLGWLGAAGSALWLGSRSLRARRPPSTAWLRFCGQPRVTLGLVIVLALVLSSLLAPLLAPHAPEAVHAVAPRLPPSPAAWLGSDPHGRDLLSRLLWGGRVSIGVGLICMGISVVLGCALGAAAAIGPRADRGVVLLTDLFLALPRLVLVLACVGLLRLSGAGNLVALVLVLGLTGWMTIARMVRLRMLALVRSPMALAGRALGLSTPRLLLRHLLPASLAPVLVHAVLGVGRVVLVEASLSFLGLGVAPPAPSWGGDIALGQAWLHSAWWLASFPGLAIVSLVVGLDLVGTGLRRVFYDDQRGDGAGVDVKGM